MTTALHPGSPATATSVGRPASRRRCAARSRSRGSPSASLRSTSSTTASCSRTQGRRAADHLLGGLVPLALLAGAAVLYRRLRAGARAATALLAGFFGVLAGTEAVHYTLDVGPSGDDYTGLLSILAGLAAARPRRRDAVAVAAARRPPLAAVRPPAAARRRHAVRRGRRPVPRCGRVRRHPRGPRARPARRLGAAYEDVAFTTSDGLRLAGLVHPLAERRRRDLVPRRASSQDRAKLLARHGYGVLALRPPRRRRERGRPEPLRLAG